MGALIVICSLVLATVVVLLISSPLRAAQRRAGEDRGPGGAPAAQTPAAGEREHRAELEAARETKYREIRDAELDYRTGKLSEADYGAIDDQLRAEALGILNELETLGAADGEDPGGA